MDFLSKTWHSGLCCGCFTSAEVVNFLKKFGNDANLVLSSAVAGDTGVYEWRESGIAAQAADVVPETFGLVQGVYAVSDTGFLLQRTSVNYLTPLRLDW